MCRNKYFDNVLKNLLWYHLACVCYILHFMFRFISCTSWWVWLHWLLQPRRDITGCSAALLYALFHVSFPGLSAGDFVLPLVLLFLSSLLTCIICTTYFFTKRFSCCVGQRIGFRKDIWHLLHHTYRYKTNADSSPQFEDSSESLRRAHFHEWKPLHSGRLQIRQIHLFARYTFFP